MGFVVTETNYAVFDPVGGLAGERASQSACAAFRLGVEAHEGLTDALFRANDAVLAAIDQDAALRGAGCTAGALGIQRSEVTVAWAGDVHVLRFRAGALSALTRAHSLLAESWAAGDASTRSRSKRTQLAGVIVRALGMRRDLDVETRTSPIEPGDVYALLSDGLFAALGEGLLTSLLHEHQKDLDAGVRALLDAGEANGGRDALTVVLVAPTSGVRGRSVAAHSEARWKA